MAFTESDFSKVKYWRPQGIPSTMHLMEPSIASTLHIGLYFYSRKQVITFQLRVPEIRSRAPISNKRNCAPNSRSTPIIIYPANLIDLKKIFQNHIGKVLRSVCLCQDSCLNAERSKEEDLRKISAKQFR